MVGVDVFFSLDLRVGKVVDIKDHEGAKKPMYVVTLDLGPEIGKRSVVAGIKPWYTKEELMNKKVVCIVNLDPKMIAGIESQGMMLAAGNESVSLLTVDKDIAEGTKIR